MCGRDSKMARGWRTNLSIDRILGCDTVEAWQIKGGLGIRCMLIRDQRVR